MAVTIKYVKRALLIGINYEGTNYELLGCIDDSRNLQDFLIAQHYFKSDEIIMMNDNQSDELYPTKANIIHQLADVKTFADAHKAADEKVLLFFSYSGHGTQIRDLNGDESDGKAECLCPVDCDSNGYLVDDDLKIMTDQLAANVTSVVLIDACHSGTVLNLHYDYRCDMFNGCALEKQTDTECVIVMISGCRDNQTSADAYEPDQVTKKMEYQGAMTASFLANYNATLGLRSLIDNMRHWLKKNKFSQVPQLSSGRKLDTKQPLVLASYNV